MRLKTLLLILLAPLVCSHCKAPSWRDGDTVVTMTTDWDCVEVSFRGDDAFEDAVLRLVRAASEPFRLIVTEDHIGKVREGDHMEIVFPQVRVTVVPTIGVLAYDRILVSTGQPRSSVTLYLGNGDRWLTAPYLVPEGKRPAEEVMAAARMHIEE